MEMEQNRTPERILNLTLEIIYLLTGENYIAFKLSDGLVTSNFKKAQIPVAEPLPQSLGKDNKKIREFTREIIKLLAGEDWENVEGHKDLYRDITVENRPPLTSPDESRNTPERCPRILYSRDSKQEPYEIPHEDQDKNHIIYGTEAREEVEEPYVMGDGSCKEEEIPPKICIEIGDAINTQLDIGAEDQVNNVMIKEEEIPPEISTDGQYIRNNTENHSVLYPDCEIEDEEDIMSEYTKKNPVIPILNSAPQGSDLPGPSTYGTWLSGNYYPITHPVDQGCPKGIPCPECGKCFSERSKLTTHRRSHTGEKPFTCMECGKSFKQSAHLFSHHRTHTRIHPFSCSECGKCFSQKSNLIRHEKVHTGEKSFSCPECGKRFSEKSNLIRHEKIHTGEKPYSCSECGRCFSLRANLIAHIRTHTGEKPFACSECGKRFTRKSVLMMHERVHTGEKPYSCTDCGKLFSKRVLLARHAMLHEEEKSFCHPTMDLLPKEPVNFSRGLTEVINRFCQQAVGSVHVSSPLSHVSLPVEDRRFLRHNVAGE